MDPELKRLLEQNLELAKQNNRMLRSMRRNAWISLLWTVIVWAVVFIAPLYLYQQYLAPIVSRFEVLAPGGAATSTPSSFFGFPSFAEIEKLLNSYKTKP